MAVLVCRLRVATTVTNVTGVSLVPGAYRTPAAYLPDGTLRVTRSVSVLLKGGCHFSSTFRPCERVPDPLPYPPPAHGIDL